MHLDPILPALFAIAATALLVGLCLRRLHQPHVVSYILVGIVLGPSALGLITDGSAVSQLGSLGVVILLFFVGLEVSPEKLLAKWRLAVLGTLLQIILSLLVLWAVGQWLDWPIERIVLLGFVISLSSTAVVLKLLQQWRQLETPVGQNVLGILLVQDFAIVPMMLIVSLLSGEQPSAATLVKQIAGVLLLLAWAGWMILRQPSKQSLPRLLAEDPELQLFAALSLCFGLAVLTGWLELSTALGAFIAGLIVGQRYDTQWLHETLAPLRDLFVALFFLTVGLLIDVTYAWHHIGPLLLLVALVMLVNTGINAAIVRGFGESWPDAIYAGVILSQVGEFSFVLAALGWSSGLISAEGYQLTLALIALSLILSPAYIVLTRRLLKPRLGPPSSI